jgi:putative ABC transport system substrate-binding protein
MKRREFITLLGAAATRSMLWPLAARAQQPAMPLIGLLFRNSCEQMEELMAAFRKGLSEVGYVEGRNVTFELRQARNEQDRLPELAADLVRRQVSVIASPGSDVAALAAKAATTSIPIVFSTARDPVQIGLVASVNRPGGNVTGVSYRNAEIGVKRLGLLHELLPAAKRFAALLNRYDPVAGMSLLDLEAAAATLGLRKQPDGCVPSGRSLYRSDPQGRKARRPAGPKGGESRVRDQLEDCQGARPHHPADTARARRRGDRVMLLCCGA